MRSVRVVIRIIIAIVAITVVVMMRVVVVVRIVDVSAQLRGFFLDRGSFPFDVGHLAVKRSTQLAGCTAEFCESLTDVSAKLGQFFGAKNEQSKQKNENGFLPTQR